MNGLGLLFRREAALIVFMVATSVNNAIFAMKHDSMEAWVVPMMAFTTYAVLCFFTYKKQLLTTWATIVLLFYYGSGFAVDGVRGLGDDLPVSLLRLAVGAYFVWGGSIIFRTRHAED